MTHQPPHHHNSTPEGEMDILGDWLFRERVRVVLPYISGKLLDIGCGTNKLVKQYGHGVGVDVYQFGGADLIVEDTSKLPFESGEFNTVAILAALNHIPNRDEVLIEARRVLAPNGVLVLTMIPPTLSRVWHFIRKPWDRDQHERGMHEHEVYGFSRIEMRKMIERAGFKIQKEASFMLGVNTLYVCVKQG